MAEYCSRIAAAHVGRTEFIQLLRVTRKLRYILDGLKGSDSDKVFSVTMQRTGTTSIGKFFRDHDYRWAGHLDDVKCGWTDAWYDGDYERIFSSWRFRLANAYEDAPWWLPDFYLELYRRFPTARFVLFTRDPDAWFRSMMKHSGGNVLGRSAQHCRIYGREDEYAALVRTEGFDDQLENGIYTPKTLQIGPEHAEQYKAVYQQHNDAVQAFFRNNAPDALFTAQLEDPAKWEKLSEFLGVSVTPDYQAHENLSN